MNNYMQDAAYHSDSRVIAGESANWYESFDENRMVATMAGGCESCPDEPNCGPNHCPRGDCPGHFTEEVAIRFEVCPLCNGKGSHVNPSIDAHGLSAEDFAEDPDFAREYFRGTYDQPCNECGGRRVVPVPTDEKVLERYYKSLAAEAAYQAECAAERRMGA